MTTPDPVTTALSALRERAERYERDTKHMDYRFGFTCSPAFIAALCDVALDGHEVVNSSLDLGITLAKLAASELRLAAVIKETGNG